MMITITMAFLARDVRCFERIIHKRYLREGLSVDAGDIVVWDYDGTVQERRAPSLQPQGACPVLVLVRTHNIQMGARFNSSDSMSILIERNHKHASGRMLWVCCA